MLEQELPRLCPPPRRSRSAASPRIGPHVSLNDECVASGLTSQFQPPSGHWVSTSDSARMSSLRIAGKPHAQARVECEPVLRGAATDSSVDSTLVDPREPAWARDPVERLLGGSDGARMTRFDAEIDQREESPERSAPLTVGMNAEVAREPGDESFTHGPTRRDQARARMPEPRRRARRPARGRRGGAGSRRDPRGRRVVRRSSRLRCRGPTRACSRA